MKKYFGLIIVSGLGLGSDYHHRGYEQRHFVVIGKQPQYIAYSATVISLQQITLCEKRVSIDTTISQRILINSPS